LSCRFQLDDSLESPGPALRPYSVGPNGKELLFLGSKKKTFLGFNENAFLGFLDNEQAFLSFLDNEKAFQVHAYILLYFFSNFTDM
jgi:hypothetical protein